LSGNERRRRGGRRAGTGRGRGRGLSGVLPAADGAAGMDGAGVAGSRAPTPDDPALLACWDYGRAHATADQPGVDAPALLIEAWRFARVPMNLAEYSTINTRWLWELEAALAAWQDGKRQSGDVRRQVA